METVAYFAVFFLGVLFGIGMGAGQERARGSDEDRIRMLLLDAESKLDEGQSFDLVISLEKGSKESVMSGPLFGRN